MATCELCIKCERPMHGIRTRELRDTCVECGGKSKLEPRDKELVREAYARHGLLGWYQRAA